MHIQKHVYLPRDEPGARRKKMAGNSGPSAPELLSLLDQRKNRFLYLWI